MKKIILSIIFSVTLFGDVITIFSASSTKDAMSEIIKDFEKENRDSKIKAIFGASGKGYAQLTHGFPFDLFFSADSKYPERILKDGKAKSKPKVYANGVLAIYSKNREILDRGIFALTDKSIHKISIANPRTAPYGKLAKDILEHYKVYKEISRKIVMGDNISQTVQFVDSGNADIGLVALSLIKQKSLVEYVLVDREIYAPLQQSFVIIKESNLATKFSKYVLSENGKRVFNKYGFE
jgi:molybdate transport system substrate-binding protein